MPEILVFKTSVSNHTDAYSIITELGTMSLVNKVNFDLDDCDNILRVEGENIPAVLVEALVKRKGFECVELTDDAK